MGRKKNKKSGAASSSSAGPVAAAGGREGGDAGPPDLRDAAAGDLAHPEEVVLSLEDDDAVPASAASEEPPSRPTPPASPVARRGSDGARDAGAEADDEGDDEEPAASSRSSSFRRIRTTSAGDAETPAETRDPRGSEAISDPGAATPGRDAQVAGDDDDDHHHHHHHHPHPDADADPEASPPRSPSQSLDPPAAGSFRSPGFLRSFRRAASRTAVSVDPVADEVERAERKTAKTAKRRAKKARRRLKRLVHATNTMGAAVSAKQQTTTQLALCMQIGLTEGLRSQPTAASFADVADDALAEEDADPALVLEVPSKQVEDGAALPAFRFICHAPNRFERVREAWGLSLRNYQASFALDPVGGGGGGGGGGGDVAGLRPATGPEASGGGRSDDAADDGNGEERRRRSRGGGAMSASESDREREAVAADSESEPSRRRRRDSGGGGRVSEPGETPADRAEAARAWIHNNPDGNPDDGNPDDGNPEERRGSGSYRRHRRAFSVGSSATDYSGEGAPSDAERRYGYDSGDGLGSLGPGPAPGLGGVEGLVPRATTLRVISTSDASGKSSSWFFCSRDSRFLVKTCTAKERDVLLDILGEYSKHASEHRGTSLLPQYYGLYTIEVGSRSAHFIIMNYWFATMHEISVRYDLKGSTKGRRASAKERAKGAAAVLKDLDFAESGEVVINPMAEDVKRAVANDIEFLERNRLIDYSMMLGLHYKKNKDGGDDDRRRERQRESLGDGELGDVATAAETEASEPEPPSPLSRAHRAARAAQSTESLGPFAEAAADDDRTQFQLRALETPFGLAYLGIIDILTQYGVAKAAENLCFGALMCGADISCQPPDAYARRFRTFIDRVLVAPAAAAAEGGDEGEAEDAGAERGRRSVRSLDAEMERAAERDGADAR